MSIVVRLFFLSSAFVGGWLLANHGASRARPSIEAQPLVREPASTDQVRAFEEEVLRGDSKTDRPPAPNRRDAQALLKGVSMGQLQAELDRRWKQTDDAKKLFFDPVVDGEQYTSGARILEGLLSESTYWRLDFSVPIEGDVLDLIALLNINESNDVPMMLRSNAPIDGPDGSRCVSASLFVADKEQMIAGSGACEHPWSPTRQGHPYVDLSGFFGEEAKALGEVFSQLAISLPSESSLSATIALLRDRPRGWIEMVATNRWGPSSREEYERFFQSDNPGVER
jgi:hypothetical protein